MTFARRTAALALTVAALGACASHPAAAPAAAPAPAAAAANALPSATSILERYAKTIGGRAELAKHSSMHQVGVFEFPAAGLKADMHIFMAKPNQMLTRITIPGMGEIVRGYDGTTGWSIDPTSGPMILKGKQLDQLKIEADFMGVMHDPASFASTQTVALTDFEGKPAYELRLVRVGGDTATEYFDPTSGLLVGLIRSADSPMGRMTVTGVVGDYKPFGGMMLPTRMTQKLATGQQMAITINSVEFDTVPPGTFDLPAPIKALAAGTPAPTKP
ncbi:MAG TPA: hypothetical protein VFJ74_09110 [Gemmatimonadaceae bacterium]|nr:hypothetical protein [Gemmatimonadaceae bacterium]